MRVVAIVKAVGTDLRVNGAKWLSSLILRANESAWARCRTPAVAAITSHFQALASVIPLRPIRTELDYDKTVSVMNQLLDAGAANEDHPLADLVSTLGTLVAEYDDIHHPSEKINPAAGPRCQPTDALPGT